MKLLRCRIDNFGKLTDFSCDFTQGINTIEAENGWGKSTLAAFLKAMVYGFDTKKEAGAIEKERTYYYPWQGGTYGGELDFEAHGKQYRINRVFGRTEKTDSFQLFDLATNLESNDFTANIGEELFDLDRASFKRSVYIAQKDCVSTSSDAINAKLGNLADNTNDINNYESAMTQLKDMLNQLSPTRITGSIKKREGALTQLSMELKGYEDTREGLHQLRELYQQKLEEKDKVTAQRSEAAGLLKTASEESTRLEQRKQYDALRAACQEKEQELARAKSHFPGEVPEKDLLQNMLEQVGALEQAETTVQNFALTGEEESRYQAFCDKFSAIAELKNKDAETSAGERSKGAAVEEQFAETFDREVAVEEQFAEIFDREIDEQLTHMNRAADKKNTLRDLEIKLNVQESIAAQQELMQPMEPVVQSQKNVLSVWGVGIGIAGFIMLFAGLLSGIVGGFDSAGKTVVMIIGILLIAIGILLSIRGKKTATEQQQLLAQQQLQRQEQRRLEIQRPVDALKEQMMQMSQELQQELSEVKAFLEERSIYCEESAYQAQLYELKNEFHKEMTAYENLAEKKQKAEQAQKNVKGLKNKIDNFLSTFQIQPEDNLKHQMSELQLAAETYRIAKRNAKQEQERCRQFEEAHDIEALLAMDTTVQSEMHGSLSEEMMQSEMHGSLSAEIMQSEMHVSLSEEMMQLEIHKNELGVTEQLELTEQHPDKTKAYTLEELNHIIGKADQELEHIKQALDQYMKQMNGLQEQLDLRDEKEQELAEQQELQEQERHKFKMLKLTQEYLQQAKEQFTARYMAPISDGFRKYYEMLTGETDGQWMVDTNIAVKMKEQGQLRETARLSAGWQDLIGICMRFALVDAMYQDEKPFLILDDPFVNLDDEKVTRGNEMLRKVGREYQIIYFTCHQSRVPE